VRLSKNLEQFYSIQDLAEIASVSDDTIRRRMKELNLDYGGQGRLIRIPEDEARKILDRVARFGRAKEK
jgi:transcriptional antiterminator